jgi:hypothetical protein
MSDESVEMFEIIDAIRKSSAIEDGGIFVAHDDSRGLGVE